MFVFSATNKQSGNALGEHSVLGVAACDSYSGCHSLRPQATDTLNLHPPVIILELGLEDGIQGEVTMKNLKKQILIHPFPKQCHHRCTKPELRCKL